MWLACGRREETKYASPVTPKLVIGSDPILSLDYTPSTTSAQVAEAAIRVNPGFRGLNGASILYPLSASASLGVSEGHLVHSTQPVREACAKRSSIIVDVKCLATAARDRCPRLAITAILSSNAGVSIGLNHYAVARRARYSAGGSRRRLPWEHRPHCISDAFYPKNGKLVTQARDAR